MSCRGDMSTMPPSLYNDKIKFIEEVERHPVLWDVNHNKYNDRFYMAAAWKNVARNLNTEDKVLKARWKSLRDIFKRELKKYSLATQQYTGQWKYFHKMSFLKDNYLTDDEYSTKVEKEDNYPIEFIVENDSGTDDDDYSETYNSYQGNHSKFAENVISSSSTKRNKHNNRKVSSSNYKKSKYKEESQEDIDSDESVSEKQKRVEGMSNDVMFLKSLAPYFKLLEPTRKLVMRSKIQDLLLKEIANQDSCQKPKPS